MYHVTPTKNVKSILSKGLKPSGSSSIKPTWSDFYQKDGINWDKVHLIFLERTEEGAINWASKDETGFSRWTLLKVRIPTSLLKGDGFNGHFISNRNIPPNNIEVIKNFEVEGVD